eukprot:CAMPEP_0202726712 /NCGR_PEP_ID=MMETSP1385-20130828/184751_1 /ASSEMBLY_ACC=CAM_ASM_000861 /TAXON_ID=933848 /ORGANISM="Elphidium margaritaceum" /LENGTH=270 /DNA_ID=CAMNT_0049392939 /DNA_START=252 /DNA_END=1062 /DNA_ORIENTATION=+
MEAMPAHLALQCSMYSAVEEQMDSFAADYDSVHSYSSLLQNEEFLCLLRWKLSQKLLFCALDTADDEQKGSAMQEQMNRYVSGECLVAPLWHKLSARLQALYDPINQRRYNPLILDEHYWLQRSSVSHRSHVHDMYTLKAESVILELYCATLKFKCVACILEESNPSLDAITAFQAPVVPAEKECNHTPLQPIMHAASAYSSPSIGVSIESSSPCYSDIDFGGAYLNAAHNKPYKAKNDCKGDDDDSNNKCDYCGNDDAAELIVMSGFVW